MSSRFRRWVAPVILIGALVAVCAYRWAGNPVTVSSLLAMLVSGIALGAIYSLAASGLVVTYTTSGVFNFAQGAIGMFMAFVYWQLTEWGLGELPSLIVVVGAVAPLTGMLLDRLAMSKASRSSLVVQLMSTVAVMLLLMGLASWIWDQGKARKVPYFFGNDGFRVGETFVLWHRFITIVVGIGVAVGLRLLLHRSRMGLAMRAAVDSPSLSTLHGARPERSSAAAWALGSSLAALSGILLAPEVGLAVEGLTVLIINAFAAAILGRLKNLPLTVAGGMVIGLSTAFTLGFIDVSGRWANVPQAIPTIALIVALLTVPAAQIVAGKRAGELPARIPTVRSALIGCIVLVVGVWLITGSVSLTMQNRVTTTLAIALILIPLIPLIGWSGQVSLAPLTFAGVGAYVMFAFASGGSLLGVLGGAALAVPFGLIIALPALRLQGLYLSLATIAFARGMELLFFAQSGVLIGRNNVVQRPDLFGVSLKSQRSYAVFCAAALAVAVVGFTAMRRSTFGRRLVAMRDSEAACAMVGLDVRLLKLAVFSIAAAVGAVGGALLTMHRGTPTATDFGMFPGLALLPFLVMGGVTLVGGALFAGFAQGLFGWIAATWSGPAVTALNKIGPGGLAAQIAKNPNGVVGEIAGALDRQAARRRTARTHSERAGIESNNGPDPLRDAGDPGSTRFGVPLTPHQVDLLDRTLGVPPGVGASS